jgi:endonuclease/exonuclease/phosphatase family metal-dependent hydrolase
VDEVRGQVWSDTRVRVLDGMPLGGDVRLPSLEAVDPVEDPLLDVVGRLVAGNRLLVFGAFGSGALLGASLPSGGVMRRIGGGLLGAGLGVIGALGVVRAAELVSGRGDPTHAADVRAVVGAGTQPRSGTSGEQLRVVSWNVRELIGNDGTVRADDAAIDAIARTVDRSRPDVLVLQEVSQDAAIGAHGDGLAEIAERLGATGAVLVPNGIRVSGSAKGAAVLTFGDASIQDARGLRHPDPGGDGVLRRMIGATGLLERVGIDLPESMSRAYRPRTTADVLVTTADGTDVRLLGVHLSGTGGVATGGTPGSNASHERQLAPIAATIDAWRGPTLLLGDFNVNGGTVHHDYERDVLASVGLHDAFDAVGVAPGAPETRTFPAIAPVRGIDRAYASTQLEVQDARVLAHADAREGSDHLPVQVDFVVR